MPDILYALDHVCDGGGHVRLTARVNGGAARVLNYNADDIRSNLTADEAEAAHLAVLKVHFGGMTRAQVRAALLAGVTITI